MSSVVTRQKKNILNLIFRISEAREKMFYAVFYGIS